ncbi:hypothetical protein ACFL6H_04865 [Candidatus Latescibacterota bacterium]
MFKKFVLFVIIACFIVFSAGYAHAGILGNVKSWLTGEVLALFASGILALLCGAFGIMFKKIIRTFKETGEFLTTLGTALDDQRLNREELASIIKEGREIFEVWGK